MNYHNIRQSEGLEYSLALGVVVQELIEKEKEIEAFLRTMTAEEKKELLPVVMLEKQELEAAWEYICSSTMGNA